MFLFIILAVILFILLVFVVAGLGAGGAGFIIIFADVIVCMAIIIGIMYLIIKRKRRK